MHDQNGQTPQPARPPGSIVSRAALASAAARAAGRLTAGLSHALPMTTLTATAEPLEKRLLWAVQDPVTLSVGPNVNITRFLENQNEASISIDRTNPANVFMASVNDSRGTGPLDDVDADQNGEVDPPPLLKAGQVRGLVGARSTNAGATWTSGVLDQLVDDMGVTIDDAVLPPACCDPSVAFDDFGNLFTTFINRELDRVIVALSTDLGQSFRIVAQYDAGPGGAFGSVDQPTVVTGPGSVWVTFQRNNTIVASGARVLGKGVLSTGPRENFDFVQEAPRSANGNFGDIAIGPNGEVMVTYQILRVDPDLVVSADDFFTIGVDGELISADQAGPTEIYVNMDPDGFGPESFGPRFKATDSNVGSFDPIPAQDDRTIDAEAGLAWDRSGGPFTGRVYMVYTDEANDEGNSDTDIFIRFSDDNGRTWSSPRLASDEDFTNNSQFLPRIALDQTTGNIAVTWHDTREQSGISRGPNDETGFWGTVGVPTVGEAGVQFADNIKISQGLSDASRSRATLEYGDYTGLDFHNNVFFPVWADNSNSTGDNPSGGVISGTSLATFDVYTARVVVTPATPQGPGRAPVGPGSPLRPQFIGRDTITKGKAYKFQVRFESPNGVDVASLGDDDLLITGPNGYNLFADFTRAKRSKGGTVVTGTYQAFAPGGKFDAGDNGLYSVELQQGAVRDVAGTTVTAAGLLDQFLVSAAVPRQSAALRAAATAPVRAALEAAAGAADDYDDKLRAVGL